VTQIDSPLKKNKAHPESLPSLSVFFPCYNEEANLPRVVSRAVKVLDGLNRHYEIIVVDDGSTDGTARIARDLAGRHQRLRLVTHPANLGYGRALRSGFQAAAMELICYTDGDGQFDLAELPPLLSLIDRYDIVSCYRRKRQDPLPRRIKGWCWTRLVCRLFNLNIRDVNCGFKLFRREVFQDMELLSSGALIDAEVLARASRRGFGIVQKSVRHLPRTSGDQSGGDWSVMLRAFKELLELRRRILEGD
jgi:glycosyltransferase involved in cell wall biosynthesis